MHVPDFSSLLTYVPPADLLAEHVILVTGAADGIGRAVSLAAAACGATVILLDRDVKRLEQVYDAIEAIPDARQPAIYPMNLEGATLKDYADLADNIRENLQRLDGLVLNAGWAGALTPIKYLDPEIWARVIHTNLHAPVLLTQAVLSLLEESGYGSIVVSTHDTRRAFWGAYGMAKAAQEAFIAILAQEQAGEPGRRGTLRVNGVDPGPVRTRLRSTHYPGENPDSLPLPEQVTGPYLFLLGKESSPLTGQNLRAD